MRTWRIKWILKELRSPMCAKHGAVLYHPWKYWCALILKAIPGLWPFPIHLRLKDGAVIPVREFMTLYIYKEIFVDRCYDVDLPADAKILDVGANTGLFDLRMKQLYPKSVIHAYEPMPTVFAQLQETTQDLTGVTIRQCGVSDIKGKAKLYVHSHNIGGHSLYATLTDGSGHVEVDLVDLQTAVAGLGRVDLLKLDCEGAEFPIIMSMKRDTPVMRIIWEATSSLYDPAELKRHLESIGYRLSSNTAGTPVAQKTLEGR